MKKPRFSPRLGDLLLRKTFWQPYRHTTRRQTAFSAVPMFRAAQYNFSALHRAYAACYEQQGEGGEDLWEDQPVDGLGWKGSTHQWRYTRDEKQFGPLNTGLFELRQQLRQTWVDGCLNIQVR